MLFIIAIVIISTALVVISVTRTELKKNRTTDPDIEKKKRLRSGYLFLMVIFFSALMVLLIGVCLNSFKGADISQDIIPVKPEEKRALKQQVWFEYNDKGFLICKKYDSGSEERYEYDGRGNEIHTKSYVNIGEKIVCDDFFFEYDKHNNIVHVSHPLGKSETWKKYEYDKNGRMTKKTESLYEKGVLSWQSVEKFDSNGNKLYSWNSNKWEEWYRYDEKNNAVYFKQSHDGYVTGEVTKQYTYDIKGNKTHEYVSNGNEAMYEYDSGNNLVHEIHFDKSEDWYEYDSKNNLIFNRKSNGFKKWIEYEYDSSGRIIHTAEYTNGLNEY